MFQNALPTLYFKLQIVFILLITIFRDLLRSLERKLTQIDSWGKGDNFATHKGTDSTKSIEISTYCLYSRNSANIVQRYNKFSFEQQTTINANNNCVEFM